MIHVDGTDHVDCSRGCNAKGTQLMLCSDNHLPDDWPKSHVFIGRLAGAGLVTSETLNSWVIFLLVTDLHLVRLLLLRSGRKLLHNRETQHLILLS